MEASFNAISKRDRDPSTSRDSIPKKQKLEISKSFVIEDTLSTTLDTIKTLAKQDYITNFSRIEELIASITQKLTDAYIAMTDQKEEYTTLIEKQFWDEYTLLNPTSCCGLCTISYTCNDASTSLTRKCDHCNKPICSQCYLKLLEQVDYKPSCFLCPYCRQNFIAVEKEPKLRKTQRRRPRSRSPSHRPRSLREQKRRVVEPPRPITYEPETISHPTYTESIYVSSPESTWGSASILEYPPTPMRSDSP